MDIMTSLQPNSLYIMFIFRFSGNLPKEYPQEFYKLSGGYQPSELKVGAWKLFDEWDTPYQGCLSFETVEAPRIVRIGCRR